MRTGCCCELRVAANWTWSARRHLLCHPALGRLYLSPAAQTFLSFSERTDGRNTLEVENPREGSWLGFELQPFDLVLFVYWWRNHYHRGVSLFWELTKNKKTKRHKQEATFDGAGDLPVPCSYSHIFPLSARPHRVHRLSWLPSGWCKSELCMAGTQSRDWAPGRTASFFSKRRCGPSSFTFNPTLLLLLLLSRQANNQTSLLTEQDFHRNTTIRTKTLRERGKDRERGGKRSPEEENIYLILKPLLSTWESCKFAVRVPYLCSSLSLSFPPRRRRKCTCLRAVRLCARVRVRLCARGAP